jgi:hypothetical protein
MQETPFDPKRIRLASQLTRLSADEWVAAVDELAASDPVPLEEALWSLARRFAGEYLDSRRAIVWPMLEYFHMSLEPAMWANPLRGGQAESRRSAPGEAA